MHGADSLTLAAHAHGVVRKRRFTLSKRAALAHDFVIQGRLFAFTTNDRNGGATVVVAQFLRCVLAIGAGVPLGWKKVVSIENLKQVWYNGK